MGIFNNWIIDKTAKRLLEKHNDNIKCLGLNIKIDNRIITINDIVKYRRPAIQTKFILNCINLSINHESFKSRSYKQKEFLKEIKSFLEFVLAYYDYNNDEVKYIDIELN